MVLLFSPFVLIVSLTVQADRRTANSARSERCCRLISFGFVPGRIVVASYEREDTLNRSPRILHHLCARLLPGGFVRIIIEYNVHSIAHHKYFRAFGGVVVGIDARAQSPEMNPYGQDPEKERSSSPIGRKSVEE